jgi:moderate conductance mechanosensitive channel
VPLRAVSTTAPTQAAQGWLESLLRWMGVDPVTAHHVQVVVGKPLAVAIILIGALLASRLGAKAIRVWIGNAASRAASRRDSPRAENRAQALTALAASIWKGVVWFVAGLTILTTLGINLTPFVAGATVIGATIGFGAQSMIRDLLAGFLLVIEDQFGIGDTIVVGDTSGAVEDLTLRVTRLRAPDGSVWFVPNGEIRKVANTSRGWARATVDVTVPAGADVDVVLDVVRDAARAVASDPYHRGAVLEPPRSWGVVGADAETLTTRVSVKVPHADRDRMERTIREQVARRLRAAGVLNAEVGTEGPSARAGAEAPGSPEGEDATGAAG